MGHQNLCYSQGVWIASGCFIHDDLKVHHPFGIGVVPLVVNMVFQFSNVILAESALSYLGLGTGNTYPSWGAMIDSGQHYIIKAWWMISFPGLILIATLFSANDFGRKLNKTISMGIQK